MKQTLLPQAKAIDEQFDYQKVELIKIRTGLNEIDSGTDDLNK